MANEEFESGYEKGYNIGYINGSQAAREEILEMLSVLQKDIKVKYEETESERQFVKGTNMETDVMIRQLRIEAKKHENDKVSTFETNISVMCYDVANRLEEQMKEIEQLKSRLVR